MEHPELPGHRGSLRGLRDGPGIRPATWATLLAVHHHPSPIRTLVCPAFGTGTGGVSALEAGVQMRVAFEHYRNPPQHINPSMAQARQERVHYGGRWGSQHPRPIQ